MPSKIIYAIFSILLIGCVSNGPDMKYEKMISTFFKMTSTEQIEQFSGYRLDEQYEIFIFGNQVVHPPAVYLAEPFAEGGVDIIPFLKSKLESTQKDVTIRDIVTIFSEMRRLKIHDFSKDQGLIELIENKVNAMDGIWKDTAQKMVSEIQSIE